MSHNEISLMQSINNKAIYMSEIDRLEKKILSIGSRDYPTLYEYLCNERDYFKEKLEREVRFCKYLVDEINKEKETQK